MNHEEIVSDIMLYCGYAFGKGHTQVQINDITGLVTGRLTLNELLDRIDEE